MVGHQAIDGLAVNQPVIDADYNFSPWSFLLSFYHSCGSIRLAYIYATV